MWFLRQETLLFKHRFEEASRAERELFLRRHNLDFDPMTAEERSTMYNDLRALHGDKSDQMFFKVPFERVLPLVSKRAVLISGGYAYVPESEQSVVVTSLFKEHLQAALETTARSIPRMDEDDRLIPVLNSIARQCAAREYNVSFDPNNPNEVITDVEVDPLAKSGHFPLCMSNLVDHLRADGHLKHFGRLQLGLFLKGIGVPMEEALSYWRKAFTKISEDKFSKEYAYNIRFNYGREGSRKDYAPYSCQRIIMSNAPGPGDHHGCPFRHASQDVLRAMAVKAGVPETSAPEIARLAKEGHYQVACTRMFEVVRGPSIREAAAKKGVVPSAPSAPTSTAMMGSTQSMSTQPVATSAPIFTSDGSLMDTIEHPNQWFDLSYRGQHNRDKRGGRGGAGRSGGMDMDDPMDVDR
ncbi:eukaryotic and archaeal DNA primase, large subunit-domain-containing protein [Chytridium lagenaria]|nr:eukaryotic and archaeal DNA primase, large subunit-domain-containing protein [Chytridium lagenaria]